MYVKEYFKGQQKYHEKELAKVTRLLDELPQDLAELEADSIWDLGYNWLVLSDSSHKDLGARLATLSGQTTSFKSQGTDMRAQFEDVGPFLWVDLRRPKKGCQKVRVRTVPRELTITICGEVPDNYELLEEMKEVEVGK